MKKVYLILIGVFVLAGAAGAVFYVGSRNKGVNTRESSPGVVEPDLIVETPAPSPVTGSGRPGPGGGVSETTAGLTVLEPVNGSVIKAAKVAVKGKTYANAEVFVNETEGKADASGNFSVMVNLVEGENYLAITAVDENGSAVEGELMVISETYE